MASRFAEADNDLIEKFKTSSENVNTTLWVGFFKKWAVLRYVGEDLEAYEVEELDKVVSR